MAVFNYSAARRPAIPRPRPMPMPVCMAAPAVLLDVPVVPAGEGSALGVGVGLDAEHAALVGTSTPLAPQRSAANLMVATVSPSVGDKTRRRDVEGMTDSLVPECCMSRQRSTRGRL
jgi:hypothetical protein